MNGEQVSDVSAANRAEGDCTIWRGLNGYGDDVQVWISREGDFPVAFNNDELGCAGATVIPRAALFAMFAQTCRTAPQDPVKAEPSSSTEQEERAGKHPGTQGQ